MTFWAFYGIIDLQTKVDFSAVFYCLGFPGVFFYNTTKGIRISTDWSGATWNANGELVVDIRPPSQEPGRDTNNNGHTYATVDCGGECGGCIALIVDGEVVSGPPFHPNCNCELSEEDIENADEYESNLSGPIGQNMSSNPDDSKWLKESLFELGFYEPVARAGEDDENLNTYPNQNLFDAIKKMQEAYELPKS